MLKIAYTILFSFIFCTAGSLHAVWSSPPDIVGTAVFSGTPDLSMDTSQGTSVAVWTTEIAGKAIVQASVKPVGGSWSPQVSLSPLTEVAREPQVAMDPSGNAVAIWHSDGGGGNQPVRASKYSAATQTWTSTTDLSTTALTGMLTQVDIDPAGNAVAVWTRRIGVNFIVHGATLAAGSLTWVATSTLSAPGQNADEPQVSLDPSGNAIAVWSRSNGANTIIQGATLAFGSTIWTATTDLSLPGQNAFLPQVETDGSGNAIAVWIRSNGVNQIAQGAKLSFGSTVWVPTNDLSTPGGDVLSVQIAVHTSGYAVAVWDKFAADKVVQGATLASNSLIWVPTTDLSGSTALGTSDSDVALDGSGNAMAVWSDRTVPLGSIFLVQAQQLPFGSSIWSSAQTISNTIGNQVNFVPLVQLDTYGDGVATWLNDANVNGTLQSATWTLPPVVTSIQPNFGSGGTSVTITGMHLQNAIAVYFGTNAATSFTVVSNTQIIATAPFGNGTVHVLVTTPIGTSAATDADLFTYPGAPNRPRKFRGKLSRRDDLHHSKHYRLKAKWEEPKLNGAPIFRYRIYRNDISRYFVNGSKHHFKKYVTSSGYFKGKYKIAAINDNQEEGKKTTLKIIKVKN